VLFAMAYLPAVGRSRLWTITVTPLASIIGSGFLISAPLLHAHFGAWAIPALILINVVTLAASLAIRHNMYHFDPDRSGMMSRDRSLLVLGRLAGGTLAAAYVISVAFYVALLSAFGLEMFGLYRPELVKIVSTVLLAFIGLTGLVHGLHGLERLEKIAVHLKLAVIGGLLLVLAMFRVVGGAPPPQSIPRLDLEHLKVLGGMLLIMQGFETTKYLGHQYDVKPRVRAMVLAQLIALGIYVAFVWLVRPLVEGLDVSHETVIIEAIARLAPGLGIMLSLGAVFSQFSAAIADSVGTGGIVVLETAGRIRERFAYPAIAAVTIVLLWSLDVFEVMGLASRAFAAYYGLQCAIAVVTSGSGAPLGLRVVRIAGFTAVALVMLAVVLFSIPAE
jgi:hypothetical protein